jgi:hypothetical protein
MHCRHEFRVTSNIYLHKLSASERITTENSAIFKTLTTVLEKFRVLWDVTLRRSQLKWLKIPNTPSKTKLTTVTICRETRP